MSQNNEETAEYGAGRRAKVFTVKNLTFSYLNFMFFVILGP